MLYPGSEMEDRSAPPLKYTPTCPSSIWWSEFISRNADTANEPIRMGIHILNLEQNRQVKGVKMYIYGFIYIYIYGIYKIGNHKYSSKFACVGSYLQP